MVQQDTSEGRLGQRLSFSCVSTGKSLLLTSLIGSVVQAEDCLFWNILQTCGTGDSCLLERAMHGGAGKAQLPHTTHPPSLPTAYSSQRLQPAALPAKLLPFPPGQAVRSEWGGTLCPHCLTFFILLVHTVESNGSRLQLQVCLPWEERPQKQNWYRNQ